MSKEEILSEFCIPESELDASLEIGDFGRLSIGVEVIGRLDGKIVFRKHKKAIADGNFKPESTAEMRERLVDKQEKETEDED